jgi:hypothetical protein
MIGREFGRDFAANVEARDEPDVDDPSAARELIAKRADEPAG